MLRLDMLITCKHVINMKMIQIRHVPDDIHRVLKARAAMVGMSLSDYLLDELRRRAEYPTMEELRIRLAQRSESNLGESPADAVRAERDSR